MSRIAHKSPEMPANPDAFYQEVKLSIRALYKETQRKKGLVGVINKYGGQLLGARVRRFNKYRPALESLAYRTEILAENISPAETQSRKYGLLTGLWVVTACNPEVVTRGMKYATMLNNYYIGAEIAARGLATHITAVAQPALEQVGSDLRQLYAVEGKRSVLGYPCQQFRDGAGFVIAACADAVWMAPSELAAEAARLEEMVNMGDELTTAAFNTRGTGQA